MFVSPRRKTAIRNRTKPYFIRFDFVVFTDQFGSNFVSERNAAISRSFVMIIRPARYHPGKGTHISTGGSRTRGTLGRITFRTVLATRPCRLGPSGMFRRPYELRIPSPGSFRHEYVSCDRRHLVSTVRRKQKQFRARQPARPADGRRTYGRVKRSWRASRCLAAAAAAGVKDLGGPA